MINFTRVFNLIKHQSRGFLTCIHYTNKYFEFTDTMFGVREENPKNSIGSGEALLAPDGRILYFDKMGECKYPSMDDLFNFIKYEHDWKPTIITKGDLTDTWFKQGDYIWNVKRLQQILASMNLKLDEIIEESGRINEMGNIIYLEAGSVKIIFAGEKDQ